MNAAVGLMDGLGLDGDRCIRVIPRHFQLFIQYDPELEQKLKQSAAPTQPEYRDPNRINQPPSVSTTNGQV